MPVYVLQEGMSNVFKIGITSGVDTDRRRRQLNSGNSKELRPFQVIDLEPAREAEIFFHRLLVHRKIPGDGGKEFFQMQSENHMRVFLEHSVSLFRRHRAAFAGLESLEQSESSGRMLTPDVADRAILSELREVRGRLREMEDEAAFLKVEAEMLEAKLKSRIGGELGIAEVATWKSTMSCRRFCLPEFTQAEPGIYQDVLSRFRKLDYRAWVHREPHLYREVTERFPLLDTTAWRLQDPRLYARMRSVYFTANVNRRFVVLGF